ncbi:MAG: hypothetical protein ACQES9_01525 [Myxococcota bacterium]
MNLNYSNPFNFAKNLVAGVFFVFIVVFPLVVKAQGIPVKKERQVITAKPHQSYKGGFQGAVQLFAGYDSNLTYGSDNLDPNGDGQNNIYEEAIPALSVRLAPSVKWVTPELHKRGEASTKLQYGFELGGVFRQPYETTTPNGAYNDLRVAGFLKGVLYYKPSRHFRLQLYEEMNRYSEPHYLLNKDYTQSWIQNSVGGYMTIIPGDGLLDFVLNYNMDFNYFEQEELNSANRVAHTFGFRTQYRFLPRSFIWFAANYNIYQYLENSDSRNSMPIKLYGGLSTPLWLKFALTVGGGYGFSLSGNMPQTWLAMANLTYKLSSKYKIGLGYSHDYEDSLIGSYSDTHNFYLLGIMPFTKKILLQGKLGYRLENHYDIYYGYTTDNPTSRTDNIFYLQLMASYKINDNFAARLSYQFMMDKTPYTATTTTNPDPTINTAIDNDPSFMKHEVYLSISYFF